MKNKNFLIALALTFSLSSFCQSTIELAFSAIDNMTNIQFDSIKVMNLTESCDTMLIWPDTVLILDIQVGISNVYSQKDKLHIYQNYPNPVSDYTIVKLYVPKKEEVSFLINDITGRIVEKLNMELDKGYHSFKLFPGNGALYFLTVFSEDDRSFIKIISKTNRSDKFVNFEYMGYENENFNLKSTDDVEEFEFNLGDKMLYIGYAEGAESGILDIPVAGSKPTFIIQFATNIPCPGTETVNYGGHEYNTIQIRNQCWLKENLNIGTKIPGSTDMLNNGVIEKNCYEDNDVNCSQYGGLYEWDEMMQYTNIEGVQGICPPGWHIPTNDEWKILEGSVDSQYGIGDPMWSLGAYQGYDVGTKLKSTEGWINYGNGTDDFGFSALPAGIGYPGGSYSNLEYITYFWTSTEEPIYGDLPWFKSLLNNFFTDYSNVLQKDRGISVRCLKD